MPICALASVFICDVLAMNQTYPIIWFTSGNKNKIVQLDGAWFSKECAFTLSLQPSFLSLTDCATLQEIIWSFWWNSFDNNSFRPSAASDLRPTCLIRSSISPRAVLLVAFHTSRERMRSIQNERCACNYIRLMNIKDNFIVHLMISHFFYR